MSNMKQKQRKLDKLIEIQKRQNEQYAALKQRALRLRNSALYPGRKRKSSFHCATASSQAKKKRVMLPPTQQSPKKQRRRSNAVFMSHYDRLKQKRIRKTINPKQSMISQPVIMKKVKKKKRLRSHNQNRVRSKTETKAFAFATSKRMSDRNLRLIKERKDKEQKEKKERVAKLKKEKRERMQRVKAMRASNFKLKYNSKNRLKLKHSSNSMIGIRNQNQNRNGRPRSALDHKSNKNKQKRVRHSKVQKRRHSASFVVSQNEKTLKQFKLQQAVKRSVSNPDIIYNGTRMDRLRQKKAEKDLIANKRLNQIKQSLRKGKRLKINKSKSLDNIESVYKQKKVVKEVKVVKKVVNGMDALLLTPIVESDKDEIDLMIDQILTEDVCTISMERKDDSTESKEEESIEIEMKKKKKKMMLSPVVMERFAFAMDVDDEKEEIVDNMELDLKESNGSKMVIGLKEKFQKLDNLFVQISEKIDEFDDNSSSFDFVNQLVIS